MGLTASQKKRRPPNARTVKRRRDYVASSQNSVLVAGIREKTDTGYKIEGFKGKSFETYFESMEPRSSTAVYVHPKKDKTIRVLSGALYVILNKPENPVKAIPGDEVVVPRGTAFRLATMDLRTEFFVAQNAKYDAVLEVVDASTLVTNDVSDIMLKEPTEAARLRSSLPSEAPRTRRGSKAKEQSLAMRAARENKSAQVQEPTKPNMQAAATYGTNPRPSQGNFDAEGAG